MTINDLIFSPMSDIGVNDETIVKEHDELIDSGNYTRATNYLNSENYDKGARASFFNGLIDKTVALSNQLINNPTLVDEIYGSEEPINEEINWWFQPY